MARFGIVTSLAALLVALSVIPAGAVPFLVDDPATTGDVAPGDGACATLGGGCTLLAAIQESNALPGEDVIRFGPGVVAGLAEAGMSEITDDLRMMGPGTLVTRPPFAWPPVEPPHRLIVRAGVTISIDSIILEDVRLVAEGHVIAAACLLGDASCTGRGGLDVATGGTGVATTCTLRFGALSVAPGGRLDVDDCRLDVRDPRGSQFPVTTVISISGGDATIRRLTGSIERDTGSSSPRFRAISMTAGSLSMEDSSVRANLTTALAVSGGVATVTRSMFRGGDGTWTWLRPETFETLLSCEGGTLRLSRCEIRRNTGGGVGVGLGGDVEIERSRITENQGSSIQSAGTLTVRECDLSLNFPIQVNGGDFSGSGGLVILGGTAVVESSRLDSNHGTDSARIGNGGGLIVRAGNAVLRDCSLSNNSVDGAMGGLGAGAFVSGGSLRLERCILHGNRAHGPGGGLRIEGGVVHVVNTTISSNQSRGFLDWGDPGNPGDDVTYDGDGAGASVVGGVLRLWSATVTSNDAGSFAAGVDVRGAGTLVAADSLIAGNGDDCKGTVMSAGHLLVQAPGADCLIAGDVTGLITGADPLLAPIGPGSGVLATHALLPGSPARDAADPGGNRDGLGGVLAVDQRSSARIVDGNGDGLAVGDLGAHEACEDAADADADGLGNACDPCPFDPLPQRDADHDSIGDDCDDGDSDADGIADRIDACPGVADPSQEDVDADGRGDACDPCPFVAESGTDYDGDGIPDDCDACTASPDASGVDADGDGIPDACDPCPMGADPMRFDSDLDGIEDACDPCPLHFEVPSPDGDFDGHGDSCDDCPQSFNPWQDDADADGVGDPCDGCPLDFDPGQEDADGDGIGDACDTMLRCDEPVQLRVTRDGLMLGLAWQQAGGEAEIAQGSIASLPAGYDTDAVECALASRVAAIPEPAGDAYFLVAARCGSARSAFGHDSFGAEIPSPSPGCP